MPVSRDTGIEISMLIFLLEFLETFADLFLALAEALLEPPEKFFLFAFGEGEIVVRELPVFLLQLTFDLVPIAFEIECCHAFTSQNRASSDVARQAA
jgi:hypothetical protein